MFDGLLEQIPASFAIVLLILMVSFNFFFGVIRLIYLYFSNKEEKTLSEKLEQKFDHLTDEVKEINKEAIIRVGQIEKSTNDAMSQIGIIIAHYKSEEKFRQMLEDKVSSIERKIEGNGKTGMGTDIELLKQKVFSIESDIKSINSKIKN